MGVISALKGKVGRKSNKARRSGEAVRSGNGDVRNAATNSGNKAKHEPPKNHGDTHQTKEDVDEVQKVDISIGNNKEKNQKLEKNKVDQPLISSNDKSFDNKMNQPVISGNDKSVENINGNQQLIYVANSNKGAPDAGVADRPAIKEEIFHRAKNRRHELLEQQYEGKWQGDFDFICIGDPQIGFHEQKKEEDFSRKAVNFINLRKPKFVVVCGDHTHNLEGMWSKGNLELGRKKRIEELKAYKSIYSKLDEDIPLVCVCGNHDVGNNPNKVTTQLYKDEFGDDYLAFWCGGVKFLAINSQIIQGLEETSELAVAHWKWFLDELEKSKNDSKHKHLVAMCHIPPFCFEMKERDTNFNWPMEKRQKWLDKLVDAGVEKFYCAHYHHQSRGKYKGLEVVVASALGTHIKRKDPPGDIKDDPVKVADYMLGGTSFHSLATHEDTSGLLVVSVTQESLSEEWLTVASMNKEITANEMNALFKTHVDEQTSNKKASKRYSRHRPETLHTSSNSSLRKPTPTNGQDFVRRIPKLGTKPKLSETTWNTAGKLVSKDDLSLLENKELWVSDLKSLQLQINNIELHLERIIGNGMLGGVKTLLQKEIKENLVLKKEIIQNSKDIKKLHEENSSLQAALELHYASLNDMRADIQKLTTVLAHGDSKQNLCNIQLLLEYLNDQVKKVSTFKASLQEWTLFSMVFTASDFVSGLVIRYPKTKLSNWLS